MKRSQSGKQRRRFAAWLRRVEARGTVYVARNRMRRWGWEARLVERAQAAGLVTVQATKTTDLLGGRYGRVREVGVSIRGAR